MKNIITIIALFFIIKISAQTPTFYLGNTNTTTTNIIPNTDYRLVYPSSLNSWTGYFDNGVITRQAHVNTDVNGTLTFNLSVWDINQLTGTGGDITLVLERSVTTQVYTCVLLCSNPSLAEYAWVTHTSVVETQEFDFFTFNERTATPTHITQIQDTNCIENSAISVQFQTNNNPNGGYKWKKNGVEFSNTNPSSFITVSDNDIIEILHTRPSYLNSLSNHMYVTFLEKPDAPLLTTNSVCQNDNFVITAESTANEVVWYTDSAFTEQITTGLTNSGKTLTYLADFTDPKIIYAKAKNDTCLSNSTSITLNVYDNPNINFITGENSNFCGNTASFEISSSNIVSVNWYDGIEAVDSQLISSDNPFTYDITNLPIGNNTIYYIAKTANDCSTDVTAVEFNKLSNSGSVSTVSNTEYCKLEQVNINLSSTTSIAYEWFEDENMNIQAPSSYIFQNGANFSYQANTLGDKRWYYRGISSSGCATELFFIDITVNNAPLNLEVTNSNTINCTNDEIVFEASAENATNFKFYKNSSATLEWTSPFVSGNTLTLDASTLQLGENKFWVKAFSSSDCETAVLEVSFIVNQTPNTPLQSSGSLVYCVNDLVSVTVFGQNSTSYEWAYDANFNTLVEPFKIGNSDASLLQYTADSSGSTIYYFRSVQNNCKSETSLIEIEVNPQVGTLSITNNGSSYCQGETVTLVVGASNATSYEWFTDSNGTIPSDNITGSNDNTFELDTDTNTASGEYTLYVQGVNSNDCNSSLQAVTYDIKTTPYNLQLTGDTDYCTGQDILVTPSVTNGNSYEWAYDSNFVNLVEASKINQSFSLSYNANTIENTTYYVRALNTNNCYSNADSVTIQVLQGVSNLEVTNNNISVCKGEALEFVASADNATSFKFYNQNGVEIENSNVLNIDTNDLSADTYTYSLNAFNSNGCSGEEINFTFEVKDVPNMPTFTGNTMYCQNDLVSLTASSFGATTFKWYSDSFLNNEIINGISGTNQNTYQYTATNSGTFIYYVVAYNAENCTSETSLIEIEVNPQVGTLSITNNGSSYCQGETVTLVVGASNATSYEWFTDSNGTIPSDNITGSNDNTFELDTDTNTASGEYTLYVQGVNSNDCNSSLQAVTYDIKTTPYNLQLTGDTDYCTGQDILVTPSVTNGNSYEWAYDSNFVNLVEASKINQSFSLSYNANTIENTTYYVRALNTNNCYSNADSVTIQVLQGVSNLEVTNNNISVCKGEALEFVASADNATSFKFYNQNGVEIENSNVLNIDTNDLSADTYTYSLNAFNSNGCSGEEINFTFEVKDVPNMPTFTGNTMYCQNDLVSLTASSFGATTFKWYSDSFLNNEIINGISGTNQNTYQYTATNSGTFIYYVVAYNAENCTSETSLIEIEVNPQVGTLSITNNGSSYCQGETVTLVVGASNATSYEWFTDSNGTIPSDNITGSNDNTFELDTDTNTASGEYTLYVQGVNSNDCNSSLQAVTYTIDLKPNNLLLTGDTDYCIDDTVTLSINADYAVSYEWFLDVNQINPINPSWYINANGSSIEYVTENVGNLRLYYKAINDDCESVLLSVLIITSQRPTQIDVTNRNSTFCNDETAVFEASAFNVNYYNWWKNEDKTLPVESELISGSNNNKLIINTADYVADDYVYYCEAVNNNGCFSELIDVQFTIYPNPLSASISGETSVCVGDTMIIDVVSIGSISFNWFYDSEQNFPVSPLYVIGNGSQLQLPANNEESGYIYVEGVNENDCKTDLISFQYNFNTAPSNLNVFPITQIVCVGETIEIDAGADNFTNFLWWKDAALSIPLEEDRLVGSANNKVLFASTDSDIGTNTYYVQAENVSGCLTDEIAVDFEVLELPSISSFTSTNDSNQYFLGNEIDFNFNASNYTKYRILKGNDIFVDWTFGNISSFSLTDSANIDHQANYTFEISNDYCTASTNMSIYVMNFVPEILHDANNSFETLNNGSVIINIEHGTPITFYTESTNDYYLHEWIFDDGFDNVGNPVTHFFNQSGSYEVTLKITNTLNGSVTDLTLENIINVKEENTIIDINSLEVGEGDSIAFTPNPFKSQLNLILDLETSKIAVLRIYDLNGYVYFVETFVAASGQNTYTWNNPLGSASIGVYVAQISLNNEVKTFKIIKE